MTSSSWVRGSWHDISITAEIDRWLGSIVIGHRPRDVGQMLWTLHTPEVHKWIVGLTSLDKPSVPIVAPFAARPQCGGQARAAGSVVTAAVIFVTIEVLAGVTWKLARATICEESLPSARDLKIKTVVAIDIIANVRDLNDHAHAYEVRMRPAPPVGEVDLFHELQFETLPTIGVPTETMVATDSNRCETHAQAISDGKWLVICTRCGFSTSTTD